MCGGELATVAGVAGGNMKYEDALRGRAGVLEPSDLYSELNVLMWRVYVKFRETWETFAIGGMILLNKAWPWLRPSSALYYY